MTSEDKHLDAEQLDQLIAQPTNDLGSDRGGALEQAKRHLTDCERCQELVSMGREFGRTLGGLRVQKDPRVSSACQGIATWHQLVAGLLPEKEAEKLMDHAQTCGVCGPVLRQAVEDLATEPSTPQEDSVLRALETSQPRWQKTFARRLASTTPLETDSPRLSTFFPRARWIAAIAAAVVVAIWLGTIVWQSRPVYAKHLLAEAYTERRTMEYRIDGARYAPTHVTRGGQQSDLDKPNALLEAESLIGAFVVRHPENTDWLQAKARADLLDGNYDSSIQTLRRAIELQPNSPSLLTDLATAYAEQADSEGQSTGYGEAVELLGRALKQTPDDAVAIYNRAIVSDRIFLYSQAISDWEHYLRIDPQGSWAEDGRRRLAALREKLKAREQGVAQPLLDPKELTAAGHEGSAARLAVSYRLEEYTHIAVRNWLPRAFSMSSNKESERDTFRAAVRILAQIAESEHHDRWLADLLKSSSSQHFPAAIASLARTVRANDAGDYTRAQLEAMRSKYFFDRAGSMAGSLRAAVENIYALHLSHQGRLCLAAVSKDVASIDAYSYVWLRVQFHIEQAICQSIMGDLGEAQIILNHAVVDAHREKYPVLYLRAVGNAAEMELGAGNWSVAWTKTCAGLSFFQHNAIGPMQGYNLYTRLGSIANERHQPQLEVVIWREAVSMIDGDEDYLLRAMAHSQLAEAAQLADMNELSAREFATADSLFEEAPQTDATMNDRVEVGTTLAGLEGRFGRLDAALALLRQLKPRISGLSNNYLAIQFYGALGEMEARRNHAKEAELALRSAIALSELSLKLMTTEADRLTWSQENAKTYKMLVELKIRQGDTVGALELWEWYRAAALRVGTTPQPNRESTWRKLAIAESLTPEELFDGAPLPRLDEVQNRLGGMKTQSTIAYAMLPDGLAAWTYDNRGVRFQRLGITQDEIERLISQFLNLCANPKSNQADLYKTSRALYDLLISPFESSLSERRLLIVEVDGMLDRVPFEILRDQHNKYLEDATPIVESLGLYYRSPISPERTISANSPVLAVGVSVAPKDRAFAHLRPLLDIEAEVATIVDKFRSGRVLERDQATANRVRYELAHAEVFHFAGHAVESPSGSGLVLSDGLLTADSLDRDHLRDLQLAVFSGCDTESGSTGRTTDYDSFVRSFLRSGVRHVVASRWSVDSAATTSLMRQFYQGLLDGKSVPDSMRAAQAALRGHSETEHPFYWAAFSTFGSS